MSELKQLLDAAREAEEKVKQIQMDMLGHLDAETEEGKQAAMDLRPALDAAKFIADQANQLYVSMRDTEDVPNGGAARKFVPVPGAQDAAKGSQLTRSEFEAMSYADRMEFIKKVGNSVVED